MNKKEQDAINELKQFVGKKKPVNEVKEIPQKEIPQKDTSEIFDKLHDVLEKLYGTISEDRKVHIEEVVQKVLPKLPKKQILDEAIRKIPKAINGFDGSDGKNGIDGKDGQGLRYRGTLFVHPKDPMYGDFYRNETNKVVYIHNGKSWETLIKDGTTGMGGGGVGVREAKEIANQQILENGVVSIFGEQGVVEQINSASFDPNYTSASNPVHSEGLMFYDYENKTMAIYGDQSDVTLQVGQETHVRVHNNTGSTILNGSVVTILSAFDGNPCVSLSLADISGANVIGVATHDILDGTIGLATINGTVGDVNTSAFNVGESLYLSNTIAGSFQNTKPISPYPVIHIGDVVTVGSTDGKILVIIDNEPLSTPFTKVLYVSTSGTDSTDVDGTELKPYKTIKFTLEQITDNSSTIRYTILLGPGIYPEINPVQLKSYVSILSIGSSQSTRVAGTVADQPIFKGTTQSWMEGIAISRNGTSGLTGFLMEESGSVILRDVAFSNIENGLIVDHVDAVVSMFDITGITVGPLSMDTFIKVNNGRVILKNPNIASPTTINNELFCISGSDSRLEVWNANSDAANINSICTLETSGSAIFFSGDFRNISNDGFDVGDGCILETVSCYLKNISTSFLIRDNGKLEPFSTICEDCAVDISATSGATIIGTGNFMQSDKLFVDEMATIRMTHMSNKGGDEGFEIKGELHVGTPEHPSESVFGEGDSYTRNILVYIGNDTSAIFDVTTSAQSFDGSTFTFSANSVDQCIYMASDRKNESAYVTHLGSKVLVDTSATGGVIQIEYWNGSSWTNSHYMFTGGSAPYYPYGELTSAGTISATSYQVRYNNNIIRDGWTKNDPNGSGIDRYWSRWRIIDTFDSLPAFEQVKLHSNRFEINQDGWIEYFGKARPVATLPWSVSQLGRNTGLGNQNVFLGDNLGVTYTYNLFNTNGDQAGFHSALPLDCDTSTPINLCWAVRPASTGTAEWTVRWSYSNDGDVIYDSTGGGTPASADNEQIVTTSGATVEGQQKWFNVPIDISKLRPRIPGGFPDFLWISIERTTSTGNLAIFALNPEYTRWSSGGHI